MALDQAKLQIHSGSPAWSFLPNDNTYTDRYTLRQTHRYTQTHKDTDIGTDTGTNTQI